MKILVVEDNSALREGLTDLLEGAGHTVEAVADGEAATHRGVDTSIDLVLLDVMLPKRHGFDVCGRLRELRPDILILMLTARGAENDKVRGFRAGADDYLTKPFGARELLARIDALQRRVRATSAPSGPIEVDGCHIDLDRHVAIRSEVTTELSPREAAIVRLLHHHRHRVVRRAELLESVWGSRGDLATRTVDMAVANLRRKIEQDPSRPRIIRTVRGVGYTWTEEKERS
ncbi:MAG: response regulator transcription factor [Acidobacteriota bacterium]|nr:response regulator transcription factor [Acidobacteriota bacterium]